MSNVGKAGMLGFCGSGVTSATGGEARNRTQRERISGSRVNQILGQVNSERVYRETRKFLHDDGHKLNRQETEGYRVDRADGKQFFELRIPVDTHAKDSGQLRIMTDGSVTNTQTNLPSDAEGEIVSYFCDQTTLEFNSDPVKFRRWTELHDRGSETGSAQTTGGVSTSQTSIPGECVPLGGSDVCAAADILGVAAGAVVAIVEPGPFGELTLIQKIGTVGSVLGAADTACSAVELADGLVNCESDKYYMCPVFISLFHGYLKMIPACTLD